MNAEQWSGLVIAVVVGVLPAVANFILTLRNGRKIDTHKAEADVQRTVLKDKVEHVAEIVNGERERMKAELLHYRDENILLQAKLDVKERKRG